jgi:molecular chaperone DnaK (HSP70)
MSYSLGIDFGTSTTRVAICEDGELPISIPIGPGGTSEFIHSIASYEIVSGDIKLSTVGQEVSYRDDAPFLVVREVKRCLWAHQDPGVKVHNAGWNPETKNFLLEQMTISPERVVKDIMEEALSRAVEVINRNKIARGIDDRSIRNLPLRLGTAVVAGMRVREIMAGVARDIGFTDIKIVDIIEEPVLAGMSYFSTNQVQPGENVLVYDFGGGTFDVAIIRVEDGSPNQWTLLAADGEQELGGTDIDRALRSHVIGLLAKEERMDRAEYEELLDEGEGDVYQLGREINGAKERLSGEERTDILLTNFMGGRIEVELTRSDLEKVVLDSKLLEGTFNCALRAYRRAWVVSNSEFEMGDRPTGDLISSALKLGHADLADFIDRIIVVGGSTRMPLINEQIRNLWGDDVVVSGEVIDPITATALGAAGGTAGIGGIVDRLPFSITINDVTAGSDNDLYEAYAPTSVHKTNVIERGIKPEKFPFDVASGSNLKIRLYDPDGGLMSEDKVVTGMLGPHCLEVDYFGRILLMRDGKVLQEIDNPAQHQDQKDLLKRRQEAAEQRRKNALKPGIENVTRKPYNR